jgi:hypothetical protein
LTWVLTRRVSREVYSKPAVLTQRCRRAGVIAMAITRHAER